MVQRPKKLITLREVMAITCLSRSSIYLFISQNKFPSQIPIGARAVRWDENEVLEWVEARIQQRDLNVA